MKVKLLLLINLFFAIYSCGTVDDETEIDSLLEDDLVEERTGLVEDVETKKEATEVDAQADKQDAEASKTDDTQVSERKTSETADPIHAYSDQNDVERIKTLIKQGLYKRASEQFSNPQGDELKFYVGIANYTLMKTTTYSMSDRVKSRDKAKELLKQVGYEAKDDYLSARSLLWYAHTMHLNYETLSKKRLALGALHRIQTTRLRDTAVYNDSLLIAAQIYTEMGWYVQARRFYKKLRDDKAPDDMVWNPRSKSYQDSMRAARAGLEDVHRICFPDGKTQDLVKEEPVVSEPKSEPVLEPLPKPTPTESQPTVVEAETTNFNTVPSENETTTTEPTEPTESENNQTSPEENSVSQKSNTPAKIDLESLLDDL